MKKKILSLVLVVAMLASMLVLAPVSGATEKSAVVETSNVVAVGDTVAVDVTITSDMPVYGYTLAYEYDASKLHFEGITFAIAGGVENYDAKDGPAYTEVTHSGPYEIFGWTYNAKATTAAKNPIDAIGGVVVATLNFTIVDGASGEAYVAIRNLKRANGTAISELYTGMDGSTVTSKCVGDDIEYLESKVTILPEGYVTAPSDLSDFTISNGVLTKYTGDADVVVIPSTVTTIRSRALYGISASKIIIPSSVTQIQQGAIANCLNLTDVYILGHDVEFGTAAVGCHGTVGSRSPYNWTDGPYASTEIVPGSEEYVVLTTIHGAAGSTAEAYAAIEYEGETLFWSEDILCNLTFNDTVYFVPANAAAPGMVEVDGKLAVAWKDQNGTVYATGATMALTGDTELEPITIAKPQTSTEVGLKLADSWKGLSMRFKATFGVDDYATLASLGTVELGMLITPARYVSHAGAFTKEALAEFKVGETTYTLGANAYVDVALNGYFSKTDDEYTFAARLQNFSDTTLAKNPDFAAVMYATVTTADGATFTVYGDFNFAANNSVLDVAENTSTEGQTDTIKGAVANLIKKLNGEEV